MNTVSAYGLYNLSTGTYLGDNPPLVQIHTNSLEAYSPRRVWLKRRVMPGNGTIIQYLPTFDADDPEINSNTLQGWAVQVKNEIIMIDAVSLQAIVNAINACCGETPITIARFYTSGVPAFSGPTLASYNITRTDDGTPYAINRAALDYLGQYITITHLSHVSGTSVYRVQNYTQPIPVGSDVVSVV
jgi:hypothetical protein